MRCTTRRQVSTAAFWVCMVSAAGPALAQSTAQGALSLLPSFAEPPEAQQQSPFAPAHAGSIDWSQLIGNSLRLVSLEHTTRLMLQPGTRQALSGPFLADYFRSVRRPEGWNDGDPWAVNYIGHPIHGAAAGYVWMAARQTTRAPVRFSRDFWVSRGQAALWAAAYSLQFEWGPLSEASIGNVGMRPGTSGWVDHVVTPAGALVFMVLEDWVDHTVITRIERGTDNIFLRATARIALNPSRSMSAMAQGQMPWTRADRQLRR